DHKHRQQRAQQQAGPTKDVSDVVELCLDSEPEDGGENGHPKRQQDELLRIHVTGRQWGEDAASPPAEVGRATKPYLLPPVAPSASFFITRSKLKLPASWLGGNSLNVARNSPTMCWAGTQ